MNKWMQKFFMYLDRYYVKHHSLPTLDSAGLKHFKMLIYNESKKDAVSAMVKLINQERDGAIIDRALQSFLSSSRLGRRCRLRNVQE